MIETYENYVEKYGLGKNINDIYVIYICDEAVEFVTHDNKNHRTDGPSIILRDGNREWYIKDELEAMTSLSINGEYEWEGPFYDWTVENDIDIDNLTDEDVSLIKLVWG